MRRLFKKISSTIKVILLKIKYGKNLSFERISHINLESQKCITIQKGVITIKDGVTLKNGSRLGVARGGKISIGSCFVNNNTICVSLGKISIGEGVSIGPNVCIYDHDHGFAENGKINDKYKIGEIIIEDNVWIGAGAIILRNSVIGKNSIVGAGTVVKGKIPSNSLVTNNRELKIRKLRNKQK